MCIDKRGNIVLSKICIESLYLYNFFFADKCPQLTDFVMLIKSNAESAQLFESIQQDAATSFTTQHSVEAMEVS